MSEIIIVDAGCANLASVQAAFARLGCPAVPSADPQRIADAQRLVLPGVGAFGAARAALAARGLDRAVLAAVESGTPLLGICLGLQLLCEASAEAPGVAGLGVIAGRCTRLPGGARVPQLGWNAVTPEPGCRWLAPVEAAFANSYALVDAPPGWRVAWTTHGASQVAALERGPILACQFHPELSGPAGQALIGRWLSDQPVLAAASPALSPGLRLRLVPCLDVADGKVWKGVRFTALREAGDPAVLAARYAREGADELVLLDIAATPDGRAIRLDTVRRVRAVLDIPLTVGGGVRSVADARALLAAGADKISVNSAAVEQPGLLTELAEAFGRQCVVLAIDARRSAAGWEVLVAGGRRVARPDAIAWAREGEVRGAGELLVTSWDCDGTRGGCDLDLLRALSTGTSIPLIASGGVGSRAHVAEAFDAGADAVLAASVLHDGSESLPGLRRALAEAGYRVRA